MRLESLGGGLLRPIRRARGSCAKTARGEVPKQLLDTHIVCRIVALYVQVKVRAAPVGPCRPCFNPED